VISSASEFLRFEVVGFPKNSLRDVVCGSVRVESVEGDLPFRRQKIGVIREISMSRKERQPRLMALAEWGLPQLLLRAQALGATKLYGGRGAMSDYIVQSFLGNAVGTERNLRWQTVGYTLRMQFDF
jgi:hypothetical protein